MDDETTTNGTARQDRLFSDTEIREIEGITHYEFNPSSHASLARAFRCFGNRETDIRDSGNFGFAAMGFEQLVRVIIFCIQQFPSENRVDLDRKDPPCSPNENNTNIDCT